MGEQGIKHLESQTPCPGNEIIGSILDASRYGVIVLDNEEHVIFWNDWMAKTSKISKPDAEDRTLVELFPGLSNSRIHNAVRNALDKGMSALLSHALNKHSFPLSTWQGQLGPVEQMIHITPVQMKSGKNYCSIQIDDVTAAVKRERLLRDMTTQAYLAREAAEDISRLKSEFLSIVSHELRTPLTSILGSLSLVTNGVSGNLSNETKALVDIAFRNSERLLLIINDILDIEKIESGKMEFDIHPVDLLPLVIHTMEVNQAYGEKYQVTFVLHDETDGVMVNVDDNRLMQVITNLLSNAAKFSPPDKEVVITIGLVNGKARVSVTDQGSGIPETFQSQVFQKFVQADSSDSRQKGGTGLGLSICKAIIEKLGGEIGFETTPNVGTTFFFDLPVWRDTTEYSATN